MSHKPLRVIRTPHTKTRPYFSMSRKSAQDTRLSWEARGVLAYLLSKPDDWQLMIPDLQQNCGRDKIKKIIAELASFGYLQIEPRRDENGKFTQNEYRVIEAPFTENPSTVNPSMDNPLTENPHLHNTEETDKQNKQFSAEKPRRLNPVFEVIALNGFGIKDTSKLDKSSGARIGKITGWIKKHGATVDKLIVFYDWYRLVTKGAAPPKDVDKFAEWFVKYEEATTAIVTTSSTNIIDLSEWVVPETETA